jgi:hypothetical protein
LNVKEYIARLEELIVELKTYDQKLPIEMRVTAPHRCCSCCSSGDSYCYAQGEEYEFSSLSVSKEHVYDKKLKKQVLKKLWIMGDC